MNLASAKTKNLKLMLSYDTEIPPVLLGDEVRLTQILMNLISNALKFTQKGSIELRVTAMEESQAGVKVRFSVIDTGIGIPGSKINLIFDRFTQAENYTTRVYGGTGLGLNIVKSLVDLHEGELSVKSEMGKGSEFSFEITFPVGASSELPDSGNTYSEGTKDLSGFKVLLVEDNLHNQILAKTYLEKYHASVDIAGNGLIALEKLKENLYDVILMDVQMPVMDGVTTTQNIRTNMKSDIPIIGCSAHSLSTEKIACLNAGMNDYITKPYTEMDLVNALLRNSSAQSKHTSGEKKSELSPVREEAMQAFISLEKEIGNTVSKILINELLKRLPSDIDTIASFTIPDDCQKLERHAHNLSGSLSTMKLKNGHSLSRSLEMACRDKKDDVVIREMVSGLLPYLKELLEATKEYLK